MNIQLVFKRNSLGNFCYSSYIKNTNLSNVKRKIRWLFEHTSFEESINALCNSFLIPANVNELLLSIDCSDELTSMDFTIKNVEAYIKQCENNELSQIDSQFIQ